MAGGRKSKAGGAQVAGTLGGARYDADAPVQVEIRFDSPHVVTYHLWFALPGGPWEKVATGTDEESITVTSHRHLVGPHPAGTRIGYLILFVGNPKTTFKAQLAVTQNGQTLKSGLVSLQGQTSADGAAVTRGEVTL
jgi:hypothetical protein